MGNKTGPHQKLEGGALEALYQQVADLEEQLATSGGQVANQAALITDLEKQVEDLKAEVHNYRDLAGAVVPEGNPEPAEIVEEVNQWPPPGDPALDIAEPPMGLPLSQPDPPPIDTSQYGTIADPTKEAQDAPS